MPASPRVGPLLDALIQAASNHFGPRLRALAVYGSVARGEAVPTSDLDVLVIADGLPRGPMRRLRDFEPVEAAIERQALALREHGFRAEISPLLWSPAELDAFSFLHLDLASDAQILWDPDRLLEDRLIAVRRQMTELGTRRVPFRGSYYWVLKPSLRPGEVIDL